MKLRDVDSAVYNLVDKYSDLVHPWTKEHDVECEEEAESYVPCSFTGPLHYLTQTHEEAVQEYLDGLGEHVAKDWQENTKIMDFLKSDIALEVFVPKTWQGISGIEPVEFEWDPAMPAVHKPHSRPINPKLYEDAKKEFTRMEGYMYEDSDSPIAAPLVIAPKATTPFIRICGDYIWHNQYIRVGHYYIPNVPHSIEKAIKFSDFFDFDMTNSFHQIPLGLTSNKLSVITPFGLKKPKFLPEGVAPASGTLQKIVMSIFSDFEDWTIAIFDNLLALASGYQDGYEKL